ncbi:MAG: hypothetical protein HN909_03890 [Phycisphaerales bacterium]|jgi:hypothetical protein|nr:hypothetical protein [Phycisphaerales bacterium]MBT7170894.1 hypothetical protein [Phycisphaerales bacterium]
MEYEDPHFEPASPFKVVLFFIPAGLALGILAMMVLVPLWAQVIRSEHYRDCQQLRVQEAERMVKAWARLCKSAETDVVLNQRVAGGKLGLDASDEEILLPRDGRVKTIPAMPAPIRLPDPSMPHLRVRNLSDRLTQPSFRRGAMAIMVTLAVLATVAGLGRREQDDPADGSGNRSDDDEDDDEYDDPAEWFTNRSDDGE